MQTSNQNLLVGMKDLAHGFQFAVVTNCMGAAGLMMATGHMQVSLPYDAYNSKEFLMRI
jgi:hypothetical protein